MAEESESYEVVASSPYDELERKEEKLEHDINEIKSALRGTVGLTKIESHADEFIKKMMGLLESTQRMQEQVSKSNQQVAEKIQNALDLMNETNRGLSQKLSKILTIFAEATEAMETEEEGSIKEVSSAIGDMKSAMNDFKAQNKQLSQTLNSLEMYLKRQSVAPQRVARAPVPVQKPQQPRRQLPPPPLPPQ